MADRLTEKIYNSRANVAGTVRFDDGQARMELPDGRALAGATVVSLAPHNPWTELMVDIADGLLTFNRRGHMPEAVYEFTLGGDRSG